MRSHVLFGVVADDFTGACDTGVQFRKHGLETVVLTSVESSVCLKGDQDVIVVDTETRNVARETAYVKVREAAKALREIGARIVYKKIDSTLRGNLGAELDAVMDELGVEAVVVSPGFPAHNRTVIDGRLLIGKVPLERTPFAQDPADPVSESYIPALISRQTERTIACVQLQTVRRGTGSLTHEMQRLIRAGNQIIVADAEVQEDLAKIAEALVQMNILPCGSAGLAAEISRLLSSERCSKRLIVISGSVNSVTLAQIAAAEKEPCVSVLQPELSEVLMGEEKWENIVNDLVNRTEAAINDNLDVIIRLAESQSRVFEVQKLGREGISNLEVSERLLSVLSETFTRVASNHEFAGLVVVGGDTAIRVMNAMGASGIRIEEEVLPGIPAGKVVGGRHEGLRVVTKAGGFGDDQALVKIMLYLRGRA